MSTFDQYPVMNLLFKFRDMIPEEFLSDLTYYLRDDII